MYSIIGRNIAAIMRERGIMQKDLAERMGVTAALISRYLSGDRPVPRKRLLQIAYILRVAPESLTDAESGRLSRSDIERAVEACSGGLSEEDKRYLIDAVSSAEAPLGTTAGEDMLPRTIPRTAYDGACPREGSLRDISEGPAMPRPPKV